MVHHNKESSSTIQEQREEHRSQQMRQNLARRLKTAGIWAACIIVAVVIIYGLISMNSVSTKGLPTLTITHVASTDHVAGNNQSKVLIIEYSDFQCPACAAYNPLVKAALANKSSEFLFVYRDFPLKLIHAHAVESSRAAEAAALQGKFWEMHDLLFEQQTTWETQSNLEDVFAGYAVQLGMDGAQFRKDYHSSYVAAKVENDYVSGVRYNIQATPTFYINGQPLTFSSYDQLAAAIDRYNK